MTLQNGLQKEALAIPQDLQEDTEESGAKLSSCYVVVPKRRSTTSFELPFCLAWLLVARAGQWLIHIHFDTDKS